MSLSVIGAGLGRTGTLSLKLALEQLGFGPCYHMTEVLTRDGFAEHWARAGEGAAMDWDAVFAGYASAVDWPSADYWRELAQAYPAAKLILTVRDPDAWFTSTQNTIFSALNRAMAETTTPVGRMMSRIRANFAGDLHDRARCIDVFTRHNEAVRAALPPARLLVFDIAEGWDRLCRFLGTEVPDTPFPASNSTDEFRARIVRMPNLTPPAQP